MLNRAFADIKIIRNEYTRYNQYMLAKKAQAYLQKKQEVEEAQKELDQQGTGICIRQKIPVRRKRNI